MRCPLDEQLRLRPVHELDDAVVAQLQPVRDLADRGPVPAGEALERQQELVLLRREPVPAHDLLAEAQVAPDAEPEAGQRLELALGQGRRADALVLGCHGAHHITWPREQRYPFLSCCDTFE
ncbi:hypothetical protein U6N30_10015 [Blastococcus brunescens]|uniref:Uncharacterized protein n=1 Tax=Blastococcus brunescens TaxID=1564165 RepID=A0ABZ1B9S3_9ACTN|nr:hypothetical protein [Blastococcus sp. BMG 8361]WRL65860.1 hypothetical protein U6N30_10015 [Blastococcus sp. BMG 8361]